MAKAESGEVSRVLEFTRVAPAGVQHQAFASLSRRERDILAELSAGLSNADIADVLGISEKTVRNHLSHLFDKLGVWTRAQAIVFARERGFTLEAGRRRAAPTNGRAPGEWRRQGGGRDLAGSKALPPRRGRRRSLHPFGGGVRPRSMTGRVTGGDFLA